MQRTGAEQDWTCLGRADGCQLDLANRPALICDGHMACGHHRSKGHHAEVIRARVSVQEAPWKEVYQKAAAGHES